MIIECEKCKSKFNLDEGLLKDEGSKVRCSVCENIFMAFPQEPAPVEEPGPDETLDEELEETVALDSPPVLDEKEPEPAEEKTVLDFDQSLGDALEEEAFQPISPDQIPELEEEEEAEIDMEEAMDQATKIEEEVTKEETEKKIEKKSEEGEEASVTPPSKKKSRLSFILIIILVIILLALGGAVAIFYLAPDLLPDSLSSLKSSKKEATIDTSIRKLSFKAVNGSFIQSSRAGQLFVIKGVVTNNNPKSRSFILLKGSILDDKGIVIRSKSVYAGNTFTEEQLKEMPLLEINKGLKNRFGQKRRNLNVKPGSTVPLMIIFENLPKNLSEFTVEAVSSAPGE